MQVALIPHPDAPGNRLVAVEATAVRHADALLSVEYRVTGAIEAVLIPPPAPPARADELWRHTCFEAFVRTYGGSYIELNLSPSNEWASYRFSGYRRGMRMAADIGCPELTSVMTESSFLLSATISFTDLGDLPPDLPWRIGLSAVIEEKDGAKSYWALAHPPGRPDFHHEDCFALELPPPSQEDGA